MDTKNLQCIGILIIPCENISTTISGYCKKHASDCDRCINSPSGTCKYCYNCKKELCIEYTYICKNICKNICNLRCKNNTDCNIHTNK